MPRQTVIVDGNNVVGAAAEGWWRDRPAAVERLFDRLACYSEREGAGVVLVLDLPSTELEEGGYDGVAVTYARRHGRDAADERIVELVERAGGEGLRVVTSDRALRQAVMALGAAVTGAGSFLRELQRADC